jgi:exodeoxyribonuclease V beta subunit
MTIHSSKGLAFPIAIITGGLRGDNNQPGNDPYAFSLDGEKCIGFDKDISKKTSFEECHEEWRRLMYVAYTRAESLKIVPQYSICYDKEKTSINHGFPFAFLAVAIARLSQTEFARLQEDENLSSGLWAYKKTVAQILHNAKDEKPDNSKLPDFDSLQRKVNNACIYQYSYSSLASKKRVLEAREEFVDNEEISVDGNRANREDFIEASGGTNSIMIDDASALVQPCANYDKNAPIANVANYPRGANLGDALHKIFENLDFETVGNLPDENAACNNTELRNLIAETYQGNSIHIQEHPEWNDLTTGFIWNTMNAELPEIHGSAASGKTFCLKDLPAATRRAEMGFHMDSRNSKDASWMNSLCKGFIDLMFVRKGDDGEDYYSILDWKSDVMDDPDYSDKDALAHKIEEEYSIQRVLYSYLLIKWLKQFYDDLDEQQIFEKHFGGIYYALARGTRAGTCNGIYCQTWKSYSDLEKSYRNVAALMKRSAKESA